jgi:hypothetical protein
VTQQDLSSTRHRVENLSKSLFVQAYAALHQVIHRDAWADNPVSDLRVVCKVLDDTLAQRFDIPMTTLLGMLVDVDNAMGAFKTGSGPAESGEG